MTLERDPMPSDIFGERRHGSRWLCVGSAVDWVGCPLGPRWVRVGSALGRAVFALDLCWLPQLRHMKRNQ